MIVTKTSATDRSALTFTRVMLGMPTSRGSLSSRMMMLASSFWMVLPSISVRRDMARNSQHFNLVIGQRRLRHHPDEIDQLAEAPFHVPLVVADHRDSEDAPAVLVEGADFGDGHVMSVGDAVLETLDHLALVLERHGVGDRDLHLKDADVHGPRARETLVRGSAGIPPARTPPGCRRP